MAFFWVGLGHFGSTYFFLNFLQVPISKTDFWLIEAGAGTIKKGLCIYFGLFHLSGASSDMLSLSPVQENTQTKLS